MKQQIAILWNHQHSLACIHVVANFDGTFKFYVLSHSNMYLMLDSFCIISIVIAWPSDILLQSSQKSMKIHIGGITEPHPLLKI